MKYIKTEEKLGNFNETVEKLRSISQPFLNPQEVSKVLCKDKKTIIDWCKTGKLAATPKPYGKTVTYQITPQAVEVFVKGQQALAMPVKRAKKQIEDLSTFIPGWKQTMRAGLIYRWKFSENTINTYVGYVEKFLKTHQAINSKVLSSELVKYPETPDKQVFIYRSVICFSKYLVEEEIMEIAVLEKMMRKEMRPEPNKNPEQPIISDENLKKMLSGCKTKQEKAMLLLLASTGIRSNECATLTLDDLDLDNQEILLRDCKWDKTRRVGFCLETARVIREHLEERPVVKANGLFLSRFKQNMGRWGVYHRITRIAEDVGVAAPPHSFRRRFVTFNLNHGENPKKVQKAGGWADIKTMLRYDRTSEKEVVESMKNWQTVSSLLQ